MRFVKTKDYNDMSRKAANVISAQMIEKPDCVLGLATGSTPIGLYKCLVERYESGDLDFSKVSSVNLDEYRGLPHENDQSYYYFMNDNLFSHVNIDVTKTHVPDGTIADADEACNAYEEIIASVGGVDIQLLGMGHNGHIGFNEPGTSFESLTHVTDLTEQTRKDNARFFDPLNEEVPTQACTMGLKTIMKAKKVLLVANGENKAKAIKGLLEGEVTEDLPASILQKHHDVVVIIDKAAGKLLEKNY